MRKALSLIIAVSLLLSMVPAAISSAAELEIIWQETFDGPAEEITKSWSISKNGETKLQSEVAVSGNALYMRDDSAEKSVHNITPAFPATPGEFYTVSAEAKTLSGAGIQLYLKFYDAAGKQIDTINKASTSLEWEEVSIGSRAPEGTVCGKAYLAIGSTTISENCVDNVKIYKGMIWSGRPILENFPSQAAPVDGQLVKPEGDKLIYNTYNEKGDKISDFSKAGFYAGEYEIPDSSLFTIAATIEPSVDPNADDTKRIQSVIDEVYNNSSNDYFKVVKLKAGRYNINAGGISLKSGIILSGEGQGPDGTVIYATAKSQHNVVKVIGLPPVAAGDNHYITDDYVEAGSCEISLSAEDVKNYKVGDLITVYHESTEEWAEALEMRGIINVYDDDTSWDPGEVAMKMERTITAINGNTLTLDMPMYVPLMKEYSPSYIYKTDESGRITHVGIENLRVESYFNGGPSDEKHANNGIVFQNAKNCYIRDVSCKYFILSGFACKTGSKQITIKNCSNLEPVSTIAGSRRYAFSADQGSQQILFTGCYSYSGRHDFETSRPATGPIVFSDSVSDYSNAMSETHGTWSTGILYDNLLHIGDDAGYLAVSNHGIYGTTLSQGWTGAGVVMWNCLAPIISAIKPPLTYQNFVIGEWGHYSGIERDRKAEDILRGQINMYRTSKQSAPPEGTLKLEEGTSFMGNSYREAQNAPVNPRSLYKAQLAERITGSYKNFRPNAPVITSPRGEKEYTIKTNNVVIDGMYQLGAEKVTLYIDNKPYDAVLNSSNNTFKLNIELANGTHKVYATQTIGGIESTKCADRFLVVNEANGNPEYLQSGYEYNMLHSIINDNPRSFIDYQNEMILKEANKITVNINGAPLVSDVEPIELNDRVLVPMRAIFEKFGAELTWDEATATATAKGIDTTVIITENQTTAYVNGNPITLDVPATIINGRFLVPVRFISESFGADVDWNDARRTVEIKRSIYYSDNPKHIPATHAKWSHASAADKTGDRALDGDKETRWAGNEKGVWMSAEFTQKAKIASFKTLFANQDKRSYNFEIHFSNDGENFEKAFEGTSSTNPEGDVFTLKAPVEAKYFKFVGQGGSNTDWILLYEIEFYKE